MLIWIVVFVWIVGGGGVCRRGRQCRGMMVLVLVCSRSGMVRWRRRVNGVDRIFDIKGCVGFFFIKKELGWFGGLG